MDSSIVFLPAINCPTGYRAHGRPAGQRLGGSASERKKKQNTRKAAKYTRCCIAGLFCGNFAWQSSSSTSFAPGAHVLAHAVPIHRQVSPTAKRSHLRDCEELGDFPSLS